jgi:putative DNA primase/helicase
MKTLRRAFASARGVETCLAGRQMGLRPVWSAVTTAGISNFSVMAGVDGLHVFEENDAKGASAKAVEACGRQWHGAGCTVVVVTPDAGNDLNDELQLQGAAK